MEQITVGRFQTQHEADAVAALIARYVKTAEICIVDNSPPGQHDAFAVRGDEYDDPIMEDEYEAHHGQVVELAAEGINAFSGPLVGAMAEQGVYDDKPRSQERRRAGFILSVRTTDAVSEARVIATMRAAGATDIAPEQRNWRDGDWANFRTYVAPRLAARPSH